MNFTDDPTKVLFLDIDGVLNSFSYFRTYRYEEESKQKRAVNKTPKQYDEGKLDLLKQIHDATHCTIVMSSTWRYFYFDKEDNLPAQDLINDLKDRGIVITEKTGKEYNKDIAKKYSSVNWIEDTHGIHHTENNENYDKNAQITEFYERGYQIKCWLDRHPEVTRFAILDDDDGDLHLFGEHFFQTRWGWNVVEISKALNDPNDALAEELDKIIDNKQYDAEEEMKKEGLTQDITNRIIDYLGR